MAADDLSKPLKRGRAGSAPAGGGIARKAGIAGGIVVAAAVVLAGWWVLRSDPNGGEPVVVISLKKDGAGDQPARGGGSATDSGTMRDSVGPGQEPSAGQAGTDGGPEMVKITIHGGTDITSPKADAPAAAETPAARDVPPAYSGAPLAKAPDSGLVERSRVGLLPRIGHDGRRPSEVYARRAAAPTGGPNAPARIAIMIGALGISAKGTDVAISRLPGPVTLAFAPYGEDLQTWVNKARQNGHEVMLQLPMEPFDYPDNDPGPHTILADSTPAENLERLQWLMARMTGYFGVTNYMGAKFTSDPRALTPVLDEINKRGLAFVDDGSSPRTASGSVANSLGLPAAVGDLVIDAGRTPESIEAALTRLEAMARERGFALGVGTGLPATVESIAAWSKQLKSRGIVLVPVSALMAQQPHG